MTAEMAIDTANQMRPGNSFPTQLKLRWLREADGVLREMVVGRALLPHPPRPEPDGEEEDGPEAPEERKRKAPWTFEGKGADRATDAAPLDEVELLAPPPFDGLYPHYLAAQIDANLGEADRAANELSQYNALSSGFAAWMRRNYPPKKRTTFRC